MEEQQTKTKRKRSFLDVLLLLCTTISIGGLLFLLCMLPVLPMNWVYGGGALLIGFCLLYFILILANYQNKIITYMMRVMFLVLLCVSAFLDYSIYNSYLALDEITTIDDNNTINISILTKKDSLLRKSEHLENKTIGIQNGSDQENSEYVVSQLKKEGIHATYTKSLDYLSLYESLLNDEIEAMVVSNTSMALLEEHDPSLKEQTQVIAVYQKEKKVEKTTVSSKDIRYEPFTVYLAGSDEGELEDDTKYDVNILLFVNPVAKQIKMVTIPRDTYVPNPALANKNDKLTHLGIYGMNNSIKELEQIFGIEIDYYAKMNFFSVIDIVDTLGGITVDVPFAFVEQDEYRSFAEEDLIHLDAGIQEVDGREALALARHRKTYGDLERGLAQQEIIKGVISKLTSLEGSSKINQLLAIAPDCVMTNMPMSSITQFISNELEHPKTWSLESVPLLNGTFDNQPCASFGSQPLSIMYLSKTDALAVKQAYDTIYAQTNLNDFTFDMNNLSIDTTTVLPKQANFIWAP